MHKKIPYKSLIIVTTILGIFISLQLRSINIENNGMTTLKKGEQLAQELKSLKKEEADLQEEIYEIQNSIDSYKSDEDGSNDDSIKSEIKKYEELAGYTDVKGEGIKVTIKSTNNNLNDNSSNNISYNYDILLSLINKLNSAQANAISMNNQRIVHDSYIHLKEDKLYLNDSIIKEPFIIKAIGNSDTLASALQIKYGIVWEIEKYYNAKVTVEKSEDLKIEASSERKYLEDNSELIEDDEN
ncbi:MULTISPECIES: DUF881 domain-containing protein [unclassified Romboutsia]|uniref:DUF881 domain-containing protein n=1 Tax=unclassified Romboutsia TaxID=2626894 RepID=UPI0008223B76|nr:MULTISPECIES: DUF881 domain-containing protein [unclassified Romboutsia]SCH15485.1 Bacterial protein of uncharacterised function (DUF881) [uncultured Clostridium sp.]